MWSISIAGHARSADAEQAMLDKLQAFVDHLPGVTHVAVGTAHHGTKVLVDELAPEDAAEAPGTGDLAPGQPAATVQQPLPPSARPGH